MARGQGVTEATLAWVVSEDPAVRLTFEKRPEGGEGKAV